MEGDTKKITMADGLAHRNTHQPLLPVGGKEATKPALAIQEPGYTEAR